MCMLPLLSRSLTDPAVVVGVLLFFVYAFGPNKISPWVLVDVVMFPGFHDRSSVTKSTSGQTMVLSV